MILRFSPQAWRNPLVPGQLGDFQRVGGGGKAQRSASGAARGAQVLPGVLPPADVALVLVWNADGQLIQPHVAGPGEVEDVLVCVVQVAGAVDRFVVAYVHVLFRHGDGLDPVDGVLQPEYRCDPLRHPERAQLVGRPVTDVEEKRAEFGDVEFISAGSSLKICLVAEGRADLYPRLGPTMEWDTAAGQAIAESAGARVYQYDTREPLIYNKADLHNPWFIVQRET